MSGEGRRSAVVFGARNLGRAVIENLAADGWSVVGIARSEETLAARKDDITGLAIASDERIEAYVLYVLAEAGTELLSLRSFVDDGGARLKQLLGRLRAEGTQTVRFPKVHPDEISKESAETLGFSPGVAHLLYAARARSA